MSRSVPELRTDAEAEAFLDQDLSDLDFDQFTPTRFEFEPTGARVNMRLPQNKLSVSLPLMGRVDGAKRQTGGVVWRHQ